MRIGISGHQAREGIDWLWVKTTLIAEIGSLNEVREGLTSLAAGTDQVFADVCLSLSIPLTAVIPLPGYERFFEGAALSSYERFFMQSRILQLDRADSDEDSFFRAGVLIADQSDLLLAVWDGLPSKGRGGTADIVAYATGCGRSVRWLNPVDRSVKTLDATSQEKNIG
jgi:hypothetical protein